MESFLSVPVICFSISRMFFSSESDETTWNVSDFSQSDSVDTEPAGPSKTVSPLLPGMLLHHWCK